MDRAQTLAGDDPSVLYDQAVTYTLLDNITAASESLTKALAAGYPKVLVRADPQFNAAGFDHTVFANP